MPEPYNTSLEILITVSLRPNLTLSRAHAQQSCFQTGMYLEAEVLLTRAQSVGGGCITTADRATYIILSHAGTMGGGALSPGDEQLVKMVENDPSRAALSQEWVNSCIRAGRLVDLEPYRIVSELKGATSSGGTVERLSPPDRQLGRVAVARQDQIVGVVGVVHHQGLPSVRAGRMTKVLSRSQDSEEAEPHYSTLRRTRRGGMIP